MRHDRRRIMVTGGAGFLGSHLCDELIARGDHVVCVDNFHTGFMGNVAHLLGRPNFTLVQHDITMPLDFNVDEIYNFASPASPFHYQRHPIETLKASLLGAINLLELAVRTRARIFQASTSEIYGHSTLSPQPESYWGNVNPVGPRACYDEAKRCAETLFFAYHRQHDLDIRVARFFNAYGPRMHPKDGRVVSNFIVQAITKVPLTIYGDGLQTRSFCYVDDLIEGCIRLMEYPRMEGLSPINLGNPAELTILDLARLTLRLTGSPSILEFHPSPPEEPKQRRPDISKARRLLNWRPRWTLEDGLMPTIAFLERAFAASPSVAC